MNLTRIEIENYRSIEHLVFTFEKNSGKWCHTLIGINETGKSNLLKAMQFLDKSFQLNYQHDCNRHALQAGKNVKVTFVFEDINPKKITEKITDELQKKILAELTFESISKEISYDSSSKRTERYVFNIKKSSIETLQKNESLWMQIPEKIKELFKKEDENLHTHIASLISVSLDSLLPKVIFWKYAPQYLISEPINLTSFKNNPDGT